MYEMHHHTSNPPPPFPPQDAVLLLQRLLRSRYFLPLPPRWETTAFQFLKPPSVAVAERERQGWAVLRRRSRVERRVVDVDKLEWR